MSPYFNKPKRMSTSNESAREKEILEKIRNEKFIITRSGTFTRDAKELLKATKEIWNNLTPVIK